MVDNVELVNNVKAPQAKKNLYYLRQPPGAQLIAYSLREPPGAQLIADYLRESPVRPPSLKYEWVHGSTGPPIHRIGGKVPDAWS